MYSLDKIEKNNLNFSFHVPIGTGWYGPIRVGRANTKFETEQKYTNFVKLSERSVPTSTVGTETVLITLVLVPFHTRS